MAAGFLRARWGQRKSTRDVIVRELVCNRLVHREFVSPHIARIAIDREGVHESASCALFAGPVTLESLDFASKNPIIANFFTQTGRFEELESGTRNLYKFPMLFSGKDSVLEDGDQSIAFVPAPSVMVGVAESECGHDAAASVDRSGAVVRSKRNCSRTEVETVVNDLSDSFAATEVGERITRVGERTVRRYLAEIVKEGKLISVLRGRSTTYREETR